MNETWGKHACEDSKGSRFYCNLLLVLVKTKTGCSPLAVAEEKQEPCINYKLHNRGSPASSWFESND